MRNTAGPRLVCQSYLSGIALQIRQYIPVEAHGNDELMVEGTAQAWIDHYGAMAAAANSPTPSPVAGDALPWRPRSAPSRPVVADDELIELYRQASDATLSNGKPR